MASHVKCSADGFAAALGEMLEAVFDATENGMEPAVREACRVGVRSSREHADSAVGSGDGLPYWRQGRSLAAKGRYKKGFRQKVDKKVGKVVGHVYNGATPGLVHLLEKGHARVGKEGGRVQSYPHFTYAADDAFEEMDKQVRKAIEEALKA